MVVRSTKACLVTPLMPLGTNRTHAPAAGIVHIVGEVGTGEFRDILYLGQTIRLRT